MDMGLGDFGLVAWPDRADEVAFGDRAALSHAQGPELDEGDRVSVGGPNGDSATARRHEARKGHSSACRRDHGGPEGRADVDSAVLASCVRVVAEVEGS
jgi:hypothetical protein